MKSKSKEMQNILHLKNPVETYQPRLTRFLKLMVRVRGLKPIDMHLWKWMDTPAFQDTETALKITLINERLCPTKKYNKFID